MSKTKKIVFRTAKLLSDSRRRTAETGIAIAYEHHPKDAEEKKHGAIFAVIELSGPTASSEEIAELLVTTLHKEYYKDLDRDPLESFEASLSKVNEELANITDQGKIHWLGKLNAVLAVLVDRTLHLTQSGSAEGYLFRKENMTHISKDLAGDSINPLRTFINIASGELAEDDKVGLFSPAIFYHLSKDELKKYITEFNPNTAVSHLAELLEGLSGQRRSSALIIELLTPESLANYTIESAPDEVWVQESKGGVEAITKGTAPIVISAAQKSAGYATKAYHYTKSIALPYIIHTSAALIEKVISLIKNYKNEAKENVFISPKEAISARRGESLADSNDHNLTERPERTSLVYSTFNKFSTARKKTAEKVKLPGRKNLKTIVITSLGIALVFGMFFSITGKISGKKAESSKKSYEEAVAKYDEGNALLTANEKERGLNALNTSKQLAADAKENKDYKKQAEELLVKISAKEELALGITRFSEAPLTDLDNLKATGLLGLQKLGSNFYAINSNTGAAYEINATSGEAKEIVKENAFQGKPVAATAIEETNKIVILTDEPVLYELDIESREYSKLSVSGDLEKGVDIASFGSSIYVLTPEDESIYKHIKIVGGYGQKNNYIKTSTESNVKNGTSLTIDGNLYVLSESGDITKYASGVQKTFDIKGLPQKPEGANKIYANTDGNGFYILNKKEKSIITVDKDFNFLKQIKCDDFGDLKGIYAGDDNIIYALSGSKIYKITQ